MHTSYPVRFGHRRGMTGTLRHLGLPSVMVMVLAPCSPSEPGDRVQATGPAETPAVSRRPKFNRACTQRVGEILRHSAFRAADAVAIDTERPRRPLHLPDY